MSGVVVEFAPRIPPGEAAYEAVKALTTPQLKRAWDAWTWIYQPYDKGDYILEALHAELNARGEGLYCAV